MGKVTRAEWRWAMLFAALVMVLTTLPYLVAVAVQTDDRRFSGFLFGVEDGNSYIAKMGQGARGAWLFMLPYSSEPQSGVLVYGWYLVLGKLAGPEHDTQVLVYHATRIVFGWLLLLVSYLFLAEFLPRVYQRKVGLVLVALGGGLGWLLTLIGAGSLFGSLPVDFYSPEAYTFLVLYGLPHLALARCLLLLGLLAYLRGHGGWAGLAFLGASFIQPLTVLVAWAVMILDFGLSILDFKVNPKSKIQNLKSVVIAGLISAPVVVYTVIAFSVDPVLRQWNAQNILTAPSPVHYLLGYGLWLLPGVLGWRALAHRRPRLARFVLGWTVVAPFLLYAPLATQRRLIEGFQLPLVAMAVLGLTVVLRRWRFRLIPAVLALTLPTSGILLLGGTAMAVLRPAPMYISADELQAFNWLARHAEPSQVVLSAFETGNALPAYTPLVAYIGHGPETVFLADKQPRVVAFYQSATSNADRQQLLADGHIRYVIFGPRERALGAFDPQTASYLQWQFASGEYVVYGVLP